MSNSKCESLSNGGDIFDLECPLGSKQPNSDIQNMLRLLLLKLTRVLKSPSGKWMVNGDLV